MSEPFIGEVRLFGFEFAPRGWALCAGQLLSIQQNQALFSLLGTTYGGNGTTTFALPDLRGRVPVHIATNIPLGQMAGEESHTLISNELPAHTHQTFGDSGAASSPTPTGNVWATAANTHPFAATANTPLSDSAIAQQGGGQGHPNMQPFLVCNYCIALQGIFPSRN